MSRKSSVECSPITLIAVTGTFATTGKSHAHVSMRVEEKSVEGQASGNGPIEAVFEVIRQKFPHDAALEEFRIVGKGNSPDMPGEAVVVLAFSGGGKFTGRGEDVNIITAAARAYLHALNSLRSFEKKRAGRRFVAGRRSDFSVHQGE